VGVVDFSSELFRVIAGWGVASPAWVQAVAVVLTDALLLAFIPLAVFVWWRVDRRVRAMLAILLSGGSAWVLNGLVKEIIEQPRPCFTMPIPTVEHCSEVGVFSLPSGHSATAAAFAVTTAALWRRAAAVVAVAALLEAFLRVYLGVHYPHDVVLGLLFGTLLGTIAAVAGKPGARRPPAAPADTAAATTSAAS
jgi:membrane-associated phospholipid phosphatase